jgi:hypothetical protein
VLGLDYSGGRPSGAAVARAGYGFVMRYLVNGLSGRANLTAAEVSDMHSAGVAVAVVWEKKQIGQPDRVTLGRPAGVADAQAAVAQANDVGLPDNPIYFCVDFDIPDYSPGNATARAKLGPVGDYFEGVLSVLPRERVGVYGGFYAVSRVLDAGLAEWAWQTAAWSGTHEDPRVHLFQRVGTVTVDRVDCDVNEARQPQFGQIAGGDMASWDDTISPDGLLDKDGHQVTDKVKNFLGYGDNFAREAKEAAEAALAAVQALAAKVAAGTAPAPQIDLDALAAKVAAHIHLSGTVRADGDQPPATTT